MRGIISSRQAFSRVCREDVSYQAPGCCREGKVGILVARLHSRRRQGCGLQLQSEKKRKCKVEFMKMVMHGSKCCGSGPHNWPTRLRISSRPVSPTRQNTQHQRPRRPRRCFAAISDSYPFPRHSPPPLGRMASAAAPRYLPVASLSVRRSQTPSGPHAGRGPSSQPPRRCGLARRRTRLRVAATGSKADTVEESVPVAPVPGAPVLSATSPPVEPKPQVSTG
jgi:hypothetical protein